MWRLSAKAQHAKHFIIKSDPLFAKDVCKLSRHNLGLLIRLVSGHNSLNAHRAKVDKQIDVSCRLCGVAEETFWHLINCRELTQERNSILVSSFQGTPEWNMFEIMEFARCDKVRGLFRPGTVQQVTQGSDTSSDSDDLEVGEEDGVDDPMNGTLSQ